MCRIYKEWLQESATDVSNTQESVMLERKHLKPKMLSILSPPGSPGTLQHTEWALKIYLWMLNISATGILQSMGSQRVVHD